MVETVFDATRASDGARGAQAVTEDEVRNLVARLFLRGDTSVPLDADTDLLEEGICDSLGLVQLAGALEKAVPGVKIPDQEVTREHLGSIAAITVYLASRTRR